MNRGKDKCKFLRNIRRQVAEQYGLRYEPRECHHEDDCPGTCPVCDVELRDLQCQLKERGIENIDVFEQVEIDDYHEVNPNKLFGPGVPAGPEDNILTLEGDVTRPEDSDELKGPPKSSKDDNDEDFGEPYRFCYVAGISFHNINDIWDELYVGAKLVLVRQPDNKYDGNAIAVALANDFDPEEPESFDFSFILGYIPRSENEELAAMMDEGYRFGAEISELNHYAPYNERLGIIIMRYGKTTKPSARYRALLVDDEEFARIQASLLKYGFIYQRWGSSCFSVRRLAPPIKGEKVVILHKRENNTLLYLTTVGVVGDDVISFVSEEKINTINDDCSLILFNLIGPVVVPNWSLDFLDKEDIRSSSPLEKFLSKSVQVKLDQIFTAVLK
jgi:hypothetical protein